jgi:hypothetical protein
MLRIPVKIARGLYSVKFKKCLPPNAIIEAHFLQDIELLEKNAADLNSLLGPWNNLGDKIFEWRQGAYIEYPGYSCWLLRFYEAQMFLVLSIMPE